MASFAIRVFLFSLRFKYFSCSLYLLSVSLIGAKKRSSSLAKKCSISSCCFFRYRSNFILYRKYNLFWMQSAFLRALSVYPTSPVWLSTGSRLRMFARLFCIWLLLSATDCNKFVCLWCFFSIRFPCSSSNISSTSMVEPTWKVSEARRDRYLLCYSRRRDLI